MGRIRYMVLAVAIAGVLLPASTAFAAPSSGPTVDAGRRLEQATLRLRQLNDQVEHEQGRLDALSRQLDADRERQAGLAKEMAGLARYQYEQPSPMVQLISAQSVGEVLSQLSQNQVVGSRQQALMSKQRQVQREDELARAEIQKNLKSIQASRDQAAQLAVEAEAAQAAAVDEAGRQQAAQVAAQASAVAVQPSAVAVQPSAVAVQPAAAAPVRAGSVQASSGPNHFTYGYCTWYVANRRYIPWYGNAIEWWPNARAYGFAEGSAPQVGAVMVTRESGYGHVAYVESVNGDGSWTVSEMNYAGWGVVTRRTIRPGQVPLVGFIYGQG